MQYIGQRISVVGTTGCGKTTVAREILTRLQVPHIELDALYWKENWTGVPAPVFQERVTQAVKAERWAIDGNYSRTRDLVWERADTVVYLDYSFWRIFLQLTVRTVRRSVQKEELWHGNREDLWKSFFSRDSILLWMMQTYHRRRKQYARLFQQPQYACQRLVHLKTPHMTAEWLSGISSTLE